MKLLLDTQVLLWATGQPKRLSAAGRKLLNGPRVPFEDYYMRVFPTFEVETGPHDWLMRHAIVGIGQRENDGNRIRYYAML